MEIKANIIDIKNSKMGLFKLARKDDNYIWEHINKCDPTYRTIFGKIEDSLKMTGFSLSCGGDPFLTHGESLGPEKFDIDVSYTSFKPIYSTNDTIPHILSLTAEFNEEEFYGNKS